MVDGGVQEDIILDHNLIPFLNQEVNLSFLSRAKHFRQGLIGSSFMGRNSHYFLSLKGGHPIPRLQVTCPSFAFRNHLPVAPIKKMPRVRNFSLHLPHDFCPSLCHSKVWQAAGLDKVIYQNDFWVCTTAVPHFFFSSVWFSFFFFFSLQNYILQQYLISFSVIFGKDHLLSSFRPNYKVIFKLRNRLWKLPSSIFM